MIEVIRVPGLDDVEQDILTGLLKQLHDKRQRNQLRSAYYDGKNAVRDLGISTPPSMKRVAVVLGWSAKAVDLLNRRCRWERFEVPGMSADDLGLTDLTDQNQLRMESRQAGLSSLIHSTAFLVTTQGDVQAGEPDVLITARSALSGTGSWSRRKRALESFLSVIENDDDGNPIEMVLYVPGKNIMMSKTATGWRLETRTHPYGVPVDMLTYKADLDRPFGRSRISRAVMAIHDGALRTVLRSEVAAELFAMPQRALLGADEKAFQNADGSVKTAWQAILGQVWAIPDDEDAANPRADIKEFSAASQQPHVDQLRAWSQLFSGETGIPVGSLGLGAAEANPTSAESYGASREDIIGEAEDTTDGWTPAWRRVGLRALQMRNGWDEIPDEFRGLRPLWRPASVTSKAAAADAASKTIDKFPWLANSELGLELYDFPEAFLERARVELRKQRGSAALQQIVAAQAQVTDVPDAPA